jgi:hypothetical protein
MPVEIEIITWEAKIPQSQGCVGGFLRWSGSPELWLYRRREQCERAAKCSIPSGRQWEWNGHETAGFSFTTTQLYIGRWWSRSKLPSTLWRLRSKRHVPMTLLLSATLKCSGKTTIRETRRSHCKSDESTDRSIDKRFRELQNYVIAQGNFSEGNVV